jgi:hypothetical protein
MTAVFDDGVTEYTTPSPMGTRGKWTFEYLPILAKNGRGEAVTASYSRATWEWDYMSIDDFDWWCTTLLGGAASKVFDGGDSSMVNHIGEPTFVSYCVVYRPTHGPAVGARFTNVRLEIGLIL